MWQKERDYSYEKHKNLLLLVAIVSLSLCFLFAPKGVEYSGTDDAAENAISTIQKALWTMVLTIVWTTRPVVESLLLPFKVYRCGNYLYVIGYQRGKHQDK